MREKLKHKFTNCPQIKTNQTNQKNCRNYNINLYLVLIKQLDFIVIEDVVKVINLWLPMCVLKRPHLMRPFSGKGRGPFSMIRVRERPHAKTVYFIGSQKLHVICKNCGLRVRCWIAENEVGGSSPDIIIIFLNFIKYYQ